MKPRFLQLPRSASTQRVLSFCPFFKLQTVQQVPESMSSRYFKTWKTAISQAIVPDSQSSGKVDRSVTSGSSFPVLKKLGFPFFYPLPKTGFYPILNPPMRSLSLVRWLRLDWNPYRMASYQPLVFVRADPDWANRGDFPTKGFSRHQK